MTAGQPPMSRPLKPVLAVTAGVGVLVNCWYRGPVFGILPFALVTVPPALLVGWILLRLRLPRVAVAIVASLAAVLLSISLCAPPSTAELFRIATGNPVPKGVRDLQRWNDAWARDPAFYLRFHADASLVQRIIDDARLARAEFASPHTYRVALLPVPAWWQPAALPAPQIWRGVHGFGIELCYDPESQLVYLSLFDL